MNETTIKCFFSLAKNQSFTKAAEELFLSRQAVNKQILSLEAQLGIKLFNRHKNLIELTAEGKLYLNLFKKMEREFEALSQSIEKNRAPSTPLPIGYAIGMIIDQRILGVIEEYRSRKTDLDIKIERYSRMYIKRKLLNRDILIAFGDFPQNGSIFEGFSYITIDHLGFVLAVSNKHPKVNENTVLSDFDGELAIYWNSDGTPEHICREHFNTYWDDIEISLVPTYLCSDLSSAYSEMLFNNAVCLCSANNEICTFPEIITYPLAKKQNFSCVWNDSASPDVIELAESFRKFEIEPL